MPGVSIDPALLELRESLKGFQTYALRVQHQMKAITESPSMKALDAMRKKYHEQTKIIRKALSNPRFRVEVQLLRKKNKGTELGAFLYTILIHYLTSLTFAVINVKNRLETKTGRERMMALRGLAQSCAPNAQRVSDMYLSMVAARRFA